MIQFNKNRMSYIDQYGSWIDDISAYFFPERKTSEYIITSDCDVSDPFADCTRETNVQQLVTFTPIKSQSNWRDWIESWFGYGQQDISAIQTSPNVKVLLTIGALALTGYLMYFKKR